MVRTRRQRADAAAVNSAGFQDLPVDVLQVIFSHTEDSKTLAAELHLDYASTAIQAPDAASFGAHISKLTLRVRKVSTASHGDVREHSEFLGMEGV
ncbi:hypothetical protein WJX73_008789 [Symbiochloris irregularis]|uniref:F-box domain-containing protein n=1 Tax=Symbiochloris irregularis TaxID=706552 RepID=A0AAW1PMZ5_9CHLO